MSDEAPSSNGPASGSAATARRGGSPYPKAELLPRLVARFLDLLVAILLSELVRPNPVGALAALLYVLFADGLFRGQSLGKRIVGIKVIHVPTRRECGYRFSVMRNASFGIVWLFYMVPLLGTFLFFTVGLPIVGFEGYMIYTDKLGIRVGDIFADTQVVDTKVLAQEGARPEQVKRPAVVARASNIAFIES